MRFILLMALLFLSVTAHAAEKETAFERIMRTKELRCGYVNYPPLLSRDPNTNAVAGIGADVMTRIAEFMHVKLVWTQETSWAEYPADLEAGRYDMLCTLDFFLPIYVGRLEITDPLFFTGIGIYKRASDGRFGEGFRDFNDPAVTISAIDGSLATLIKASDYPKAKLLSMPAMTDYTQILENVAAGKADIAFVERNFAAKYMQKNPGKLVSLTESAPLRIYPYFVPMRLGEDSLRSTINGAIALMVNNGEIDKILARHGGENFYPVARAYQ